MGILKSADAQTLARRALDSAERCAAASERCLRKVITSLAAGQSVKASVVNAAKLYAEIFSVDGTIKATMTLTDAAGESIAQAAIDARMAAHTFDLPSAARYDFSLTATSDIASARLLLCVKGGSFAE